MIECDHDHSFQHLLRDELAQPFCGPLGGTLRGHQHGTRSSPSKGHVHYDNLHLCGGGGEIRGSSCGACGVFRLGFRGRRGCMEVVEGSINEAVLEWKEKECVVVGRSLEAYLSFLSCFLARSTHTHTTYMIYDHS